MKRKICAFGLTAALSISLLTTSALAAETSFKDVSGHWAEQAVGAVVEKKLFNGTSEDTFSPDASMNRGMFVTVLGRFAENLGFTVSGTSTFSDVSDDAYYAKYVAWGASNNIVKGVSETEFAPGADVTREQMCTLFVRFLEYVKYPMPTVGELSFVDANQISDWAADAVKSAVALGLIQGISTDEGMSFDPAGNATRAQVATVFLRLDGLAGIHDLKPAEPVAPTEPANPETPATPEQPAQPTTPEQPSGGGGGAGGGGGNTVPVDTAGHTQAEINEEAEIVGYLRDIVVGYSGDAFNNYTKNSSQEVKDAYRILIDTVKAALNERDTAGSFLSKEFIQDKYKAEIAEVKGLYRAMDKDTKDDFVNAGIRLGNISNTQKVMKYFGVSANI